MITPQVDSVVVMDAQGTLRAARRCSSAQISRRDAADAVPAWLAGRTRFLVLLSVTACMTLIMCNALTLNFAVICIFDGEQEESVGNRSEFRAGFQGNFA